MTRFVLNVNHDPELRQILDRMMNNTVDRLDYDHPLKGIFHHSALATLFRQICCDTFIKEELEFAAKNEKENKLIQLEIKEDLGPKKISLNIFEQQLLILMGTTQKLLTRPSEKIERGDVQEAKYFQDGRRRQIILNSFEALGLSDPKSSGIVADKPMNIIVCGGFSFRFWDRMITALKFIVEFLKKYKQPIQLIIAGGSRLLKDDYRDRGFLQSKLPDKIKEIAKLENELEMLKFITEYFLIIYRTKHPEIFDYITVSYTSTLPQLGNTRAHTQDVAGEIKVEKRDTLTKIVTEPPFWVYQLLTHQYKMENNEIQAIVGLSHSSTTMEDRYDALSRAIYITVLQVLLNNHPDLSAKEIDLIVKQYKDAYAAKKYDSIISRHMTTSISELKPSSLTMS